MKRLSRSLTPSLLLLACALAGANRPAAARQQTPPALTLGEWEEFAPAGGGFSILFPGTPQTTTQTLRLSPERSAELHIHSLTNPTLECSVIYADYPIPVGDPKVARAVLDSGARGAVASVNAELLSLTEITHEGHPGRLLRERMPDGKILRAKMVLVGQRLYQIAFTTPREDGAPAETLRHYEETADKFLDSFKLDRAPVVGPAGPSGPQPARPSSSESSGDGEVDRYIGNHPGQVIDVKSVGLPRRPGSTGVGGVTGGAVISKPLPAYPALAKAARASGVVIVRVVVDEEGRVVAAQAESGHPLLHGSAVRAAREARFEPHLLDGRPVQVAGAITYNFHLRR